MCLINIIIGIFPYRSFQSLHLHWHDLFLTTLRRAKEREKVGGKGPPAPALLPVV